MIILKKYASIKNFLWRFTLLKIGNLHIRLHYISDKDRTTLFHNHPFNYISIILKGGYIEHILHNNSIIVKSHNPLAVIFRKNTTYHRIESLHSKTLTLFITYGKYNWNAINISENHEPNGIFKRYINNKQVWSKRYNGIYFIGHSSIEKANKETRHSIHQI